MIKAITPYNVVFGSKQNLARKASTKMTRNVVNVKDSSLKGLTKTPIRTSQVEEGLDAFVDVSKFSTKLVPCMATLATTTVSVGENISPIEFVDDLTYRCIS